MDPRTGAFVIGALALAATTTATLAVQSSLSGLTADVVE